MYLRKMLTRNCYPVITSCNRLGRTLQAEAHNDFLISMSKEGIAKYDCNKNTDK